MAKTKVNDQLRKADDLVAYEDQAEYTRDTDFVDVDTGDGPTVETKDIVGIPVMIRTGETQWKYAPAADISTPTGIDRFGLILHGETIEVQADTVLSNFQYTILKQGPAIILQDELPANDAFGNAITIADLVARLAENHPPIDTRVAPPLSEQQTT